MSITLRFFLVICAGVFSGGLAAALVAWKAHQLYLRRNYRRNIAAEKAENDAYHEQLKNEH